MIEHEPTCTLWVCIDCTMILTNGETNPEWSEAREAEHLTRMEYGRGQVDHYTMGTHHEHCTHEDDDERQECGNVPFSWTPCDICASSLGGERHAFVGWIIRQ